MSAPLFASKLKAELLADIAAGLVDITELTAEQLAVIEAAGEAAAVVAEAAADTAISARDEATAVAQNLLDLAPAATLGLADISTSDTSGGAGVGTYVYKAAATRNGAVSRLRVRNKGANAFTLYWRKFTVSGLTATPVDGSTWQALSVPAGPGNTEFNLLGEIAEGETIGVSVPADRLNYLIVSAAGNEPNYYLRTTTQQADGFTAAEEVQIAQLQLGIDYIYPVISEEQVDELRADLAGVEVRADDLDVILADISERTLEATGSARVGPISSNWTGASGAFYEWAIPIVPGYDMGADDVLAAMETMLHYTGTVLRVEAMLVSRPNDAAFLNSSPGNAGDTNEWSAWQSVDVEDLGFAASTFGSYLWECPEGEAPVGTGKVFYLLFRAFGASDARVVIGYARSSVASGLPQHRRGWYRPTSVGTAWTNLSGVDSLAIKAFTYRYAVVLPDEEVTEVHYGDRIKDAEFVVAGLGVTTTVDFERDGVSTSYQEIRTMTAAAAGYHRYDVLYIDAVTKSFGVVAGTARQNDGCEFIPAAGTGSRIVIAHLRVSDTAVTAVPMWRVSDGVDRLVSDQLSQDRAKARARLPRLRAAIQRLEPQKIGFMGDSIIAIATNNPLALVSDSVPPNGAYRDRATATQNGSSIIYSYLRDKIGSDLITSLSGSGGLLELFTAVELGMADDGEAAVHTKFSFGWELVKHMENLGYTLGTDLHVENFARAGWASGQMVSGGVPTTWAADAIASDVQTLIWHIGMNEYDGSSTRANMEIVLNASRAAGKENIVMGVELKNSGQTLTGWDVTNRALRAAAESTGSAFIPMEPLYDPRFQGLGIAPADRCSANRINHPGIREHLLIGQELIRAVLG